MLSVRSLVGLSLAVVAASGKTLYLAGDSTMAVDSGAITGWGTQVGKYLSLAPVNLAVAGTSARTYTTGGYCEICLGMYACTMLILGQSRSSSTPLRPVLARHNPNRLRVLKDRGYLRLLSSQFMRTVRLCTMQLPRNHLDSGVPSTNFLSLPCCVMSHLFILFYVLLRTTDPPKRLYRSYTIQSLCGCYPFLVS